MINEKSTHVYFTSLLVKKKKKLQTGGTCQPY